ncbi:helicase-related protein [uncultured Capnocytophaga sp.]|jgi:superfamily II DNA or RNA helicase|uniref:helicase-related protein n=1 Tax=uncultured Capnocytophaga sp. TaxID=159273 RepID=UPI00206F9F55|nr:helicase-related protein [uncultured Capnocytophaga sp.]DAS17094.1 MAG TPA: Helicase of the snf2 rad54 family [Caudoviricetes sp.]
MNEYQKFLQQKQKAKEHKGFTPLPMNPKLFPFQQYIVAQNIMKGKHAVFADCGLGKTVMELETASQIVRHTNKPVLIIAPLVVVAQTKREAEKFGFDLDKVTITNFENLHNINPQEYAGLIVDESSIMKNFEGQIKKQLFEYFHNTPYKFAFTATPSPNDPMELANHSEFLGYQSRLGMLATYFINDQDHTSKWRLKGHAVEKFYQFVSSWAIMLTNPADIGYPMQGYDLSDVIYKEHQIITQNDFSNGLLFPDMAVSATDFNKELRRTKEQRIAKAIEIANADDDPHIVWVKHNDESKEVTAGIRGAVEVSGSDTPEDKAQKLLDFVDGKYRVLVTKPQIAKYGLNFQHCLHQTFMSPDFSFEGFYQAVRRSHRFGKKGDVTVNIITTDTMQNVMSTIREKETQFKQMQKLMIKNQEVCKHLHSEPYTAIA